LKCTKISDSGGKFLPLSLKSLSITANKNIGKLTCERIAMMSSLKKLELKDCSITDRDAANFPLTLELLDLEHNHQISHLTWERISQMTSLKKLSIYGCTTITDVDVLRFPTTLSELKLTISSNSEGPTTFPPHLKKHLPNCKITWTSR
jgi:hypothetical protein